MADDPDAKGRVVIDWTVKDDGRLKGPIVVESEFGDEEFRACIGRALAEMSCLPKPEHGESRVRYPIMFAPG